MLEMMIIDARGKAMAAGGRYRLAQHLRWLRGSGAGNRAAWIAARNAKLAYVEQCGLTADQKKHSRLVALR